MRRVLHSSWSILRDTVKDFFADDSFSHASAIAFSTIFSLPAILIIVLAVGSTFYERNVVQDELINQVGRLVGTQTSKEIESILTQASFDSKGWWAKIVGVVTLAVSATTVFMSLQNSLNKIWGIKAKPERGWVKYIVNRLLSLAMVISFAFVLLVSLVVDTVLVVFQGMLSRVMEGLTLYLVTALNLIISLSIVTVIFGLMFKVLPDARIQWRHVWVGALITTLLFTLGKYLIGFYLGNSSFNTAYGAAGSLVIVLLWVYYSTVIFLFGAELTQTYAKFKGAAIQPYSNAVKVQLVELERK
jgi:membrane protein